MKLELKSIMVISVFFSLASSIYTMHLDNAYAQERGPLTVAPFKGVYSVGQTVLLFGKVNTTFTAGSSVTIKVTNPNGQTYQNTNVQVDQNGTYTYQFKLEGDQATVLGVHTVEATYQSLKATGTFEVKAKPSLQLSASKSTYEWGDTVVLNGTVTPRLIEPLQIRISNPNNVIWKFFAVSPDKILSDGTFTAEIGELSGKLSIPGKYRVDASYAGNLASTSLEFSVVATGKVSPGRFMLVDQSGKGIDKIAVGQQVLVQADIRNNQQEKQQYAYLVLITDSNGFTVSISWIQGTLPVNETLSAAQSWVPDGAGTFKIQIFVWKSVSVPEILGKTLARTVTVTA